MGQLNSQAQYHRACGFLTMLQCLCTSPAASKITVAMTVKSLGCISSSFSVWWFSLRGCRIR